jgi:hypothetical protein
MHPDDLRELLRRRPFRPFRLLLTNNLVYEIRHPDMAFVTRTLLHLSLTVKQGPVAIGERQIGIAMLHIVQYEVPPGPPAVTAN